MKTCKQLLCLQNEKGMALIFVVITLVTLIGFVGLSIDIGYMYIVKGQLQNAADAGALAGAETLFQGSPPSINWTSAEANALSFVQKNAAAGVALSDAQIAAGYWNINQIPPGVQSQALVPTINDVPAVQVSVSKAPGINGGPVPTFFAQVLGVNAFPISASAVAGVRSVGTMTGGLFPIAVQQSFADSNPIISGRSAQFTLTPDSLTSSKWTTLKEGNGDGTSTVRSLTDPNHVLEFPISIGDSINNTSGVRNTLYNDVDARSGTVVVLPLLADFISNRVVGFIPFRITSAVGGSTQTITGYFQEPIVTRFGGGSGPNYGVLTPILIK